MIFLVSRPVGDDADVTQELLEQEHDDHGDILQTDIEDGHRKLGYKILTGKNVKVSKTGTKGQKMKSINYFLKQDQMYFWIWMQLYF